MPFPKTILGIAVGWNKRGRVSEESIRKNRIQYDACSFCYTRLHIGRESGVAFLYCPKCLIKINKIL